MVRNRRQWVFIKQRVASISPPGTSNKRMHFMQVHQHNFSVNRTITKTTIMSLRINCRHPPCDPVIFNSRVNSKTPAQYSSYFATDISLYSDSYKAFIIQLCHPAQLL